MSKKGFEGFTKEWMTTKRPKEAREQLWNKTGDKPQTPKECSTGQEKGFLNNLNGYIGKQEIYVFNINPVAKPRMTRSDRWKKRACVLRYRAFADEVRRQAQENGYWITTICGVLNIEFHIPFNKKLQKAVQKTICTPHNGKPDIDNLVKAWMDIFLKDDSGVWQINATKLWSNEGKIVVYK